MCCLRRFSNRAVDGKLCVAGVTGIKVLSELGMEAGVIMASDGSSGSMLFTAQQGSATP